MDADVGALPLSVMYQLRRVAITGPLFAGGVIVVASVAVVPVAGHVVGPTTSFVPAMLAVVLCFDLMSTYLLITNFLDTGELRMLLMAGAYLWSMVLLSGYALAFPGVIASVPLFGAVHSTAPWLYVGWHVGFPALLAVAWAPLPNRLQRNVPSALRQARCWRVAGSVVAVAALVVALCVHFAREMPTLIMGSNTSLMTRITAPYALPIVAGSLLIAWWGLKDRTGPERWATTAILICFCDLMLTYFSEFATASAGISVVRSRWPARVSSCSPCSGRFDISRRKRRSTPQLTRSRDFRTGEPWTRSSPGRCRGRSGLAHPSRSCSWTSTDSRYSMTSTGMRPVTRPSKPLLPPGQRNCGRTISSVVRAATSSRSCSRIRLKSGLACWRFNSRR